MTGEVAGGVPAGAAALVSRLRRAYRAGAQALGRAVYERGQLETAGWMPLADLGVDAADRLPYEPSGWVVYWRIVRIVSPRPTDVLLDLGAGKGRMVCLFARQPFARVIGVEIAEPLAAVARANLAVARPRLRAREVDIVVADVVDYEVPDDVTFVYMFNPFMGAVFAAAMRRITESLERAPRRLTLIYLYPTMHEAVLATGRFRQVHRSIGVRRWPATRLHVYESVPPAS